ncbi:MAG: hypothetical protein AAF490_00640 [Chloroflexota bacterium]
MKKVIFVGGTAYSGSTFFHMMLANDPKGYACGEVRSLLAPRKPNHRNITCSCGENPCPDWQQIKEKNTENWVQNFFDIHPDVDILVASSKSPIWIQQQNLQLKNQGIDCRNILIWKTPAEFGQSMKRRGYFDQWERSFINYYRLYASLMSEWRAVRYEDLVKNDQEVLSKACDYLEIPYFAGKEHYWERSYHVLAGNTSAKFHLYNNEKAQAVVNNYDKERMNFYRNIYYRAPDDEEVLADVDRAFKENVHLKPIMNMLEGYDIDQQHVDDALRNQATMAGKDVTVRKVKDFLLTQIGRYRYG